jgi:hypothetical protein
MLTIFWRMRRAIDPGETLFLFRWCPAWGYREGQIVVTMLGALVLGPGGTRPVEHRIKALLKF